MKNELFDYIYSIFEEKINEKKAVLNQEGIEIIQTAYVKSTKTLDILDQIDAEMGKVEKYLSKYDNEPTMAEVINKILKENSLTISNVTKKLEHRQARQTIYRLANYANESSAKKDTLICLAFCADASLNQLERLLNSSGYILAKNSQDDMLVQYCFENEKSIEFYESMKEELFGELIK
ncbi:MAG: hypothetical protein NC310_01135 [Roseburia sp.]|nr:hypothetical protein [Anaeroplasma bactoclasticum]MCM1195657.1 hypothetical protein [Roseburia sp.]MCM1556114.1 hypothetical protein [Anaeroplasma bactoclasticum]